MCYDIHLLLLIKAGLFPNVNRGGSKESDCICGNLKGGGEESLSIGGSCQFDTINMESIEWCLGDFKISKFTSV